MVQSAPIQADLAAWHTLRIRRHHVQLKRGLDASAQRWLARIEHRKHDMAFLHKEAQAVVEDESNWQALSDDALDQRIDEVRSVFGRRQYDDLQVRAALSAVREISRRERGENPYLVQCIGAMGLFYGQIVQMVTGEGKTLVGAVAATLLGWLRKPVHIITVNDYLAERDADLQASIYRRAGLTVGSITGETDEGARHDIYRKSLIYLTQKELVADWLRDQLRLGRIADPVAMRWLGGSRGVGVLIPGLFVTIVDEIDAVLIDEAVTPLIIAQPREEDAQAALYDRARDMAEALDPEEDFYVDHRRRRVDLTSSGRSHVQSLLTANDHAIWRAARRREELVVQALVAEHCYLEGQHYQVVDGQVVIVDEYSGRFMEDRQWQHGLHQAAEAKHHLDITADRDTLASMSFQRFFRQYPHLCGMTGTAADARAEMETTYGLPVRIIPTNRPLQRTQLPDLIFAREEDKWNAIVAEIRQMHEAKRPTLVGTRSIDASERLSTLLKAAGLEDHQVLNAVHHKMEAEIISEAGKPGAITVATNMAGRGTDIKLGDGVEQAGGLHVILTERHTARRVDRQLFGRSGRQGDKGSARCIISLEDDLVKKFARRQSALLRARYVARRAPLPHWVVWLFDFAQKRAQRGAFKSRAEVLRHDEELDRTLPR